MADIITTLSLPTNAAYVPPEQVQTSTLSGIYKASINTMLNQRFMMGIILAAGETIKILLEPQSTQPDSAVIDLVKIVSRNDSELGRLASNAINLALAKGFIIANNSTNQPGDPTQFDASTVSDLAILTFIKTVINDQQLLIKFFKNG
jgi:hypothetical protein